MKIDWYRKRAESQKAEVPREVDETNVTAQARDNRYRTWVDAMIEQHQRDGGFDGLENKGKPLNLEADVGFEGLVNRTLKQAKFLPKWLELQHQIYRELKVIVQKLEANPEATVDWPKLQQSIRAYNASCPHASLQKPMVNKDNLRTVIQRFESEEDET